MSWPWRVIITLLRSNNILNHTETQNVLIQPKPAVGFFLLLNKHHSTVVIIFVKSPFSMKTHKSCPLWTSLCQKVLYWTANSSNRHNISQSVITFFTSKWRKSVIPQGMHRFTSEQSQLAISRGSEKWSSSRWNAKKANPGYFPLFLKIHVHIYEPRTVLKLLRPTV